ncbi:MAG: hypothetical protein ACKOOB_03110, partial [Polynucleobacter victoriensis]
MHRVLAILKMYELILRLSHCQQKFVAGLVHELCQYLVLFENGGVSDDDVYEDDDDGDDGHDDDDDDDDDNGDKLRKFEKTNKVLLFLLHRTLDLCWSFIFR